MKKSLVALSMVAAFTVAGFAGSASAAPIHTGASVTAKHDSLTVVKAAKKTTHKKSHKKAK